MCLPILFEVSHSPASPSAAVRSNWKPSDWQPPSGFSPRHSETSGLTDSRFFRNQTIKCLKKKLLKSRKMCPEHKIKHIRLEKVKLEVKDKEERYVTWQSFIYYFNKMSGCMHTFYYFYYYLGNTSIYLLELVF